MSVLPVSFPSFSFPFIVLLYSALLFFLLKNSEKNPPYVLHIRLKSLLLHPLSETERRSVDMMAGFSVLRSRVFFDPFSGLCPVLEKKVAEKFGGYAEKSLSLQPLSLPALAGFSGRG